VVEVRPIDKVNVELSVVLGATIMPVHQLLRMGRGAVIELGATENDSVTLFANDHAVAQGIVVVNGDRIGVEITSLLLRSQDARTERVVGGAEIAGAA
jgi:flagellar motor switch protein FliN/FliY